MTVFQEIWPPGKIFFVKNLAKLTCIEYRPQSPERMQGTFYDDALYYFHGKLFGGMANGR
jgi:hypothetical protein